MRMDYGAIVYGSASEQTLKPLDIIANDCMRIATVALKTSPIQSLQTITNEKPLALRRKELTIKYYFKMRAQPGNPVHTVAVTPRQELLFQNIPPTLAIKAKQMMAELGVDRGYVKPDFSYRLLHITEPTWSLAAPKINLELAVYPKNQTPLLMYQALFTEVAHDKYQGFEHIYRWPQRRGETSS